ncbi:MAG: DUF2164 domain-containing protein [Candidatus Marinimicrobia bacterium]|jgi:uncharacterized protein (DUF2164 family)|nr:DUF2164 domain-containing protein [Candidatus Neomarinimicrobiota bacterium]MBT3937985.1 DUF2164 domain-containing protein [Candidatus Neomarinimicrobiota bacterium]MBT3961603.1 DUF2164 domain-containing protein [Candidatus Neomarinimicrobiota bacterium]MBT4382009.1 DUF2164 domain-containing protein [Candidatus Neomarinimicrobiota bacterium]MBT4636136.1 DUF2164 domain-containing protein [Candidatus Neomarinimicrobiota bacterium]|tara:strand:+ start:29 stop:280 length:252 start_codon:yes stop_codon:yes gene_type:complete
MSSLKIKFTSDEKGQLVKEIQQYCFDELDLELSRFDVEFLFDFLSKKMGTVFYNQGLKDAQAILSTKLDLITEAIADIEKPID